MPDKQRRSKHDRRTGVESRGVSRVRFGGIDRRKTERRTGASRRVEH